METFILTLHLIVCLFLIVLVLLQSGKEGMGVIFGGGSSSLFGSSGAGGFLVKLTAVCAGLFLITSLTYAFLANNTDTGGSLMDNVETTAPLDIPTDTPMDTPADETEQTPATVPGDETSDFQQPSDFQEPVLDLDTQVDPGLTMETQEGTN